MMKQNHHCSAKVAVPIAIMHAIKVKLTSYQRLNGQVHNQFLGQTNALKYTTHGQLFWSLHIPLVVLTALYIAWWGIVAHDICCVPTHFTSNTNVCGFCPHQLCKVASIAAETGIVKAVVLYLIVPHVRSLLRCELRPSLVRQVLTHPCNMMKCQHELAIYATVVYTFMVAVLETTSAR